MVTPALVAHVINLSSYVQSETLSQKAKGKKKTAIESKKQEIPATNQECLEPTVTFYGQYVLTSVQISRPQWNMPEIGMSRDR